MGWCRATEIMDTAVRAALAVFRSVEFNQIGKPPGGERMTEQQAKDLIRPMVATIAKQLRDGDWDCIEESDYFADFPREMLGLDGADWDAWVSDQLSDWDGTLASWPAWAGKPPGIVR